MATSIWVKVVGFSDVERHSLNTLFRLSTRRTPAYVLWTPEAPSPPHVGLIDVDSYEAGLELESPSFNPNLKLICVGTSPPENAWRVFHRPVDFNALVQVLDGLFASLNDVDIDLDFGESHERDVPPGVRVSLLVGMTREQRMYLRARFALAGMTVVDEAETAEQASTHLSQRRYDVVVVSLELQDADPWALVQTLPGMVIPPRSVIVATQSPTWVAMERSEQLGCVGLLEIPFAPKQVLTLLQKL